MVSLKMAGLILSLLAPFIVPATAFSSSLNRDCCFGKETIDNGDVIASFPDQCMQLFCNDTQAVPRYYDDPSACGCCEFNGKMYQTGERIVAVCTDITCHHGKWVTKGYFDECCRRCNLKNDPHITTFDGHYYHWHGTCNYSISQHDSEYDEDFGIYGVFRKCNGVASCIHKTTFTDNPNTVIEIKFNQGSDVKVNDNAYTVPGSIEAINVGGSQHPVLAWRDENCNMFLGSQGYLLKTCNKQLFVWAYPNLLNEINGLCGHYSMYEADDFTDRWGVQFPLTLNPRTFPNCWKTHDQIDEVCTLPDDGGSEEAPDKCKATPEERQRLKSVCLNLLKNVRWEDHKAPEDILNNAIRSCVSDLCIMIENGSNDEEIEEWNIQMIIMLIININIEIHTTPGAQPPGDDADDEHCHGGCDNAFHVNNKVQFVFNHGLGSHGH